MSLPAWPVWTPAEWRARTRAPRLMTAQKRELYLHREADLLHHFAQAMPVPTAPTLAALDAAWRAQFAVQRDRLHECTAEVVARATGHTDGPYAQPLRAIGDAWLDAYGPGMIARAADRMRAVAPDVDPGPRVQAAAGRLWLQTVQPMVRRLLSFGTITQAVQRKTEDRTGTSWVMQAVLHGSTAPIDHFDDAYLGTATGMPDHALGHYFTDALTVAERYAGATGVVTVADLTLRAPYRVEQVPGHDGPSEAIARDAATALGTYPKTADDYRAYKQHLMLAGFDGLIIAPPPGDGAGPAAATHYVVFAGGQAQVRKYSADQPRGKTVEGTNAGSFAPLSGTAIEQALGDVAAHEASVAARLRAKIREWAGSHAVPSQAVGGYAPASLRGLREMQEQHEVDVQAEATAAAVSTAIETARTDATASASSREEVASTLSSRPVAVAQRIDGGMNATYVGAIGGLRVIIKPDAGLETDHIRDTITPGNEAGRELAAGIVNEALGGLVDMPLAIVRDVRVPWDRGGGLTDGRALVMEFRDGEPVMNNWDTAPTDQLDKMALFDAVIGNLDRHGKNAFFSPDGDLIALDHGLAFPDANRGEWINTQAIRQRAINNSENLSLKPSEIQRLTEFAGQRARVEHDLAAHLQPEEIDAMWDRVDWMLGHEQVYPYQHQERHLLPGETGWSSSGSGSSPGTSSPSSPAATSPWGARTLATVNRFRAAIGLTPHPAPAAARPTTGSEQGRLGLSMMEGIDDARAREAWNASHERRLGILREGKPKP